MDGVCKVCAQYTTREKDGGICIKCAGKGFSLVVNLGKSDTGNDLIGLYNGMPFWVDESARGLDNRVHLYNKDIPSDYLEAFKIGWCLSPLNRSSKPGSIELSKHSHRGFIVRERGNIIAAITQEEVYRCCMEGFRSQLAAVQKKLAS